jgi:hypothetical protein
MVYTVFSLTDSTGALLYNTLYIAPTVSPISYSGSIITGDAIKAYDLATASIGINLVPNTYQVRLAGGQAITDFYITLPPSIDNTTASAASYLNNTL